MLTFARSLLCVAGIVLSVNVFAMDNPPISSSTPLDTSLFQGAFRTVGATGTVAVNCILGNVVHFEVDLTNHRAFSDDGDNFFKFENINQGAQAFGECTSFTSFGDTTTTGYGNTIMSVTRYLDSGLACVGPHSVIKRFTSELTAKDGHLFRTITEEGYPSDECEYEKIGD